MKMITRVLAELRRESQQNGSDAERDAVVMLVNGFSAILDAANLGDSPFFALHLQDLLSTWITVNRIEEHLWEKGVVLKDEGGKINPLVEVVGKARERLRRSMKDLEDLSAKSGQGLAEGLPDQFRRLMKRAEAIIEEAMRVTRVDGDNG